MNSIHHSVRFVVALSFSALLIYGDLSSSVFVDMRRDMSLVLVPFRAAAELPYTAFDAAHRYFRSRQGLLEEKAVLQQKILEDTVRLRSMDFFTRQNDELRQLLGLRQRRGGQWLAAELLRNLSQPLVERIFLNKGTDEGVLPGLAVVDEFGVLGQITRVDKQTSVVNLITDRNQWMTARVRRNQLLVVLHGGGDGRLKLEYVSNYADIRVGDELVTIGDIYPPGFLVGVVDEIIDGGVYQDISAEPVSSFLQNNVVLVYLPVDNDDDESESAQAAAEQP